jgi:EAL domain-containing protein (putative c-di-GMP-specific phosphodiesterase class I)
LRTVARRLEQNLLGGEAVGRLVEGESRVSMSRVGGDEFSCLIVDVSQAQDAAAIARRTLALFAEPFSVNGHELFMTGSVGIAIYPHDGAAGDLLMKNANAALSNAKAQGGNSYMFYSNAMNARSLERLMLESRLRNALSRGELIVHYQPKVDVSSGRIVGAEALLRWQHPELGLVPPGTFIPLAEEAGLISAIGEWVLFSACRQSKVLEEAGNGVLPIAVNVSGIQLRGPELLGSISTALKQTRLDPRSLVLELTESMLADDGKEAVEIMKAIKALGVQIALDDFGTGYSSLAHLKRLPLDELKIDKSFIDTLTTDSRDAAIVSTVVALAHGLGLRATAEGVETKAQLEILSRLKCDEYQGFLFSGAVPAERLATIVAEQLCASD